MNEELELRLIQGHRSFDHFDYSIAVDWAIDLIQEGKETDNVLMLASFSKPIDSVEIKPYVTNVLRDLELEELDYRSAFVARAHFHVDKILKKNDIRTNLRELYSLCVECDNDFGLMEFYLLQLAWSDLEVMGVNFYYDEANLSNIEEILFRECEKWVDKYIHEKDEASSSQGRSHDTLAQKRSDFLKIQEVILTKRRRDRRKLVTLALLALATTSVRLAIYLLPGKTGGLLIEMLWMPLVLLILALPFYGFEILLDKLKKS